MSKSARYKLTRFFQIAAAMTYRAPHPKNRWDREVQGWDAPSAPALQTSASQAVQTLI